MVETAEILEITERTVRRWSGCYATEGLQGRRIGRASARAVPGDDALRMVTLDETQDTGWTVTHCHERWQAAGHVVRAPRRSPWPHPTATLVRRPMPHSACGPLVDHRPNMSARCFRNR
jgi:hypothetical protein